jgi:hypothetical protein
MFIKTRNYVKCDEKNALNEKREQKYVKVHGLLKA